MTTQHEPKRWRPRFSVRTLVIVVTLVCCYFGLWGATKNHGISDVADIGENESAHLPLVVSCEVIEVLPAVMIDWLTTGRLFEDPESD